MDTKTQPQSTEILKQKIEMWSSKLDGLRKEYDETRIKRGDAAKEGDLRENAAYAQLTEEAEVLSARMNDIQKMVEQLEKDLEERGGNS